MRSCLFPVLLLTACSGGLQPLPASGTGLVVDPVQDTDGGSPLDTDDGEENEPPIADAGDDVSALVTDVVELDGSGSYDPDEDALEFSWTMLELPSGSAAYLINESRENPSFFVDMPGSYVVEVLVDDGESTDADEVVVDATSTNTGPVANAGADQTVDVGDEVQLNGSASFDPESDPLDFEWVLDTYPSGSSASLDDPSSVLPRFTADLAGTYTVELRVSDDGGTTWSPEDSIKITAQDATDSSCFSCMEAQVQLERRIRAGDAASAVGLTLLPLLFLFSQRRRG